MEILSLQDTKKLVEKSHPRVKATRKIGPRKNNRRILLNLAAPAF